MTLSRADRAWWRELLLLVAFCVVVGFVAGCVWYLVAPTPAFVPRGGQLIYVKELPGEYIAMDGWFTLVTFVAGVVVAVVVLLRGPLSPWRVVAVPLAGLLGAWVAWRVGFALGPSTPSIPPGVAVSYDDVFYGELDLYAKGVLLVWPVVSLLIVTFALAWSARDDGAGDRARRAAGDEEPLEDDASDALVGRDPDLGDVDRR